MGFKSNPATHFGTGEASKRSNLCITVYRTCRVSTSAAPTAPMFSCTAPMFSCTAPIRSKIKSTAEPGRDMRDEGVDLSDTLEERSDLVSIFMFYYNSRISISYQLQKINQL